MKSFRNQGAIGAILDEYEKALEALIETIAPVSDADLVAVADPVTTDPDCVSIQSVLTHVVRSGYGYAIIIRKHLGEELDYRQSVLLDNTRDYQIALREMFAYNEKLFADYPNIPLEEYEAEKKIKVRWGQVYDVEQLMEHAIVHILRHRRQIERFIQANS